MNHEIFNGPNMVVVAISMVFVALAVPAAVASVIARPLSDSSDGDAHTAAEAAGLIGSAVAAGVWLSILG